MGTKHIKTHNASVCLQVSLKLQLEFFPDLLQYSSVLQGRLNYTVHRDPHQSRSATKQVCLHTTITQLYRTPLCTINNQYLK